MIPPSRDPIRAALDANLDGDYSVFACGENAPRERVIAEFESRLGYQLPAEFREFSMSPYGGIYIEVKEEIWPKAKLHDVGPFWSFLRGLMTYGFAADIPEFMDIRRQAQEFQRSSGTKFAPFMQVIGDANVYCFDERGSVRRWDHETSEAPEVPKSFHQVFAEELARLKERKERMKAGRTGSAR